MRVSDFKAWFPWFTITIGGVEIPQFIRPKFFDHHDLWVSEYQRGVSNAIWDEKVFHWPEGYDSTQADLEDRSLVYKMRIYNSCIEVCQRKLRGSADCDEQLKEWLNINCYWEMRAELCVRMSDDVRRAYEVLCPLVMITDIPAQCIRRAPPIHPELCQEIPDPLQDVKMEEKIPTATKSEEIDVSMAQNASNEVCDANMTTPAVKSEEDEPQAMTDDQPDLMSVDDLKVALEAVAHASPDPQADPLSASMDSSDDDPLGNYKARVQKEKNAPQRFIHQYGLGVLSALGFAPKDCYNQQSDCSKCYWLDSCALMLERMLD